ncbi:superoxide dismutase [Novosphingobium sp.]|uniref:superoxide dismutase n=1 Tax=Novosphingobium sp. TaxID=1874826 RepID=UPI0027329C30|nr:superoxide dismutase [Novosphingobium sp.]MDP3906227.1 superoxide dismutase [Novosphingobium sp.]
MPYVLSPLPFARNALTPQISAETLEYHHGKHHQAYVDKTNELATSNGLGGQSLVDLIGVAGPGALFNNACQLWNHNFLWQSLSPDTQQPSGELADLISAGFGSTEALLKDLGEQAAGHFGSGWAWLMLDQGALTITTSHDGETPAAHKGMQPLLAVDVWEHAYYIDYRNARPRYLDAVLDHHLNWDFAALNLDGAGVSRGDQAWQDS